MAGGFSWMCTEALEQSWTARQRDFFGDQKSQAEAALPRKGWGIVLPAVPAARY